MTINVSPTKLFKPVQLLLLVAIFGLLIWSSPWSDGSTSTADRTIKITGETTIEAEPDQFTFYPNFQESGSDQQELKDSLTKKADDTVKKLKELGIEEKDITLDASSYDRWYYDEDEKGTLTVNLQIVTDNKELAQEVQDYLLTLDVKGQLSPRATFSKAKQKELDAQAVKEASEDAREKAEAQADLFNAKLGKAIKISQGSDSIFYGYAETSVSLRDSAVTEELASLPVLPGQNEYTQTVTVTYELK